MAHVVSQQYQQQQQQQSVNGTNSGYYGTTQATYQQQHGGGNYSHGNYGPSSSHHSTYWNGQSGGYTNNQPGNYYSGGTSQQVSSTAVYPRSHWYNKAQQRQQSCCMQTPPSVATGNQRSSMKRTYSTDTALHDITNGTNAPKRRKFAPINTTHAAHTLPKGVPSNTTIVPAPSASSIDQKTGKVRIESIFRHVELLAQSYWQTGKCPAASVLKPTTVDAFEGGSASTSG